MKVNTNFVVYFSFYFGLLISFMINSCGTESFKGDKTKFRGNSGMPVSNDATKDKSTGSDVNNNVDNDEDIIFENVLWLWNCDDGAIDPIVNDKNLIIKGNGIHKIKAKSINNTPMFVEGKLCVPPTVERNIVFVVDVSKSMTSSHGGLLGLQNPPSDPVVGMSCGRLNAIEKLIDTFNGYNVKYAIVTFSDTAIDVSSKFFSKEQELYEDLINKSSKSNIVDILCAGYSATNYNEALNAAKDLMLTQSSQNALKEIYFISDGQPDPSDKNGINIAKELKDFTNIATIMLGSADDKVMRQHIASIDMKSGLPLHAKVNNAAALAEALAELANNMIQKAELWYKGKNETEWVKINLIQYLEDNTFSYKALDLNYEKYSQGLELIYKYADRFNHVWEYRGEITWD